MLVSSCPMHTTTFDGCSVTITRNTIPLLFSMWQRREEKKTCVFSSTIDVDSVQPRAIASFCGAHFFISEFFFFFFYHRNCQAKQYNNGRWSPQSAITIMYMCALTMSVRLCAVCCRTESVKTLIRIAIFLTAFHFIVAFSYRLRAVCVSVSENNTKMLAARNWYLLPVGFFAPRSYRLCANSHTLAHTAAPRKCHLLRHKI